MITPICGACVFDDYDLRVKHGGVTVWGVALKSDGTVYAGQPAVHLVRYAIAAAVLWPVVL